MIKDRSLTEGVQERDEAASFVLRAERQDRNIVDNYSMLLG